jgi:hypothetical protein
VLGQGTAHRPLSPRGQASTQVGGSWVQQDKGEPRYQGGQWIDIDYGRPILRGRTDIFGSGADYGKRVDSGAAVWRAGANQTTRIKTEAPLVIGGKTLQPGEYSLFVELSEGPKWTLVVSSQPYQEKYDRNNKEATWGAYGYDSKYDVVRTPMTLETSDHSIDQFTIGFVDVTDQGGKVAMGWDHTVATVEFKLAK